MKKQQTYPSARKPGDRSTRSLINLPCRFIFYTNTPFFYFFLKHLSCLHTVLNEHEEIRLQVLVPNKSLDYLAPLFKNMMESNNNKLYKLPVLFLFHYHVLLLPQKPLRILVTGKEKENVLLFVKNLIVLEVQEAHYVSINVANANRTVVLLYA